MIKLLLPLLFLSASANAATPLITKVNQSGHVPAEYRSLETCEVYPRRVVITTEMGSDNAGKPVVMRRVHRVALSAGILQMIAEASKEEFRTDNMQVCDAATTKISAAAPGIPSFVIFQSGACSEPRGERIGGRSFHLRYIIDSFCPETNDPGAGDGT